MKYKVQVLVIIISLLFTFKGLTQELIINDKLYILDRIGSTIVLSNNYEPDFESFSLYYTQKDNIKYLIIEKPQYFNANISSIKLLLTDDSFIKLTISFNSSGFAFYKLSNTHLQKLQIEKVRKIIYGTDSNQGYENVNEELGSSIMDAIIGKEKQTSSNEIKYSNKEVTTTEDKIYIKLEKSHSGIWRIPVIINGSIKISLVFDTGAADLFLPIDIVSTLFKTKTNVGKDIVGTDQYVLADGSTVEYEYFYLKELKIGDVTINNVKTVIIPNSFAEPLLGQNVISRIGTFKVNATSGYIEIDK